MEANSLLPSAERISPRYAFSMCWLQWLVWHRQDWPCQGIFRFWSRRFGWFCPWCHFISCAPTASIQSRRVILHPAATSLILAHRSWPWSCSCSNTGLWFPCLFSRCLVYRWFRRGLQLRRLDHRPTGAAMRFQNYGEQLGPRTKLWCTMTFTLNPSLLEFPIWIMYSTPAVLTTPPPRPYS